jgi:hypothetical protein
MGREKHNSKRYMKQGSYVAEISNEGNVCRFVIRDEQHRGPSIYGAKPTMDETEHEVQTVLSQLELHRAA